MGAVAWCCNAATGRRMQRAGLSCGRFAFLHHARADFTMTDSSPADSARRSARPQQHRLSLPITSRGLLISLLFLLSGVSALVYQVVWVRQLTTVFGATIYAVSTVLTAFMGGLALGSWLVGKRADMMKRPLVAFGVLEILTAAAAFGFPYVLDWVTPVIGWAYSTGGDASFYSFSLLRFGLIGGLLLVPTTLMGATLPVLSRAVVRDLESIGHRVGGLYAVNTLGAMLGAFLTGFVLLERFGIWHTTVL